VESVSCRRRYISAGSNSGLSRWFNAAMSSKGGSRGGALALVVCALVLLAFAAPASGAIAGSKDRVTTFPQPRTLPTGGAEELFVDPAGWVWFTQTYEESHGPGTEPSHPPRIVRMNPLGETEIVADHERAEGFARTADGSVWWTGGFFAINRIAPDGSVHWYPLPETATEYTSPGWQIVAGSDGNVWFGASRMERNPGPEDPQLKAMIVRLTPAGEFTEFALPGRGGYPTRLTLGPDGNVWFTERNSDRVGKITPSGEVTTFPLPYYARPGDIAVGADGALWFAEEGNETPAIGRITTSGALSEFPLDVEERSPYSLTAGSDGRIWFALGPATIARISPSGRLSRVQLPHATGPSRLAAGPEGNVWYTAGAGPPCAPGDSGCGDGGYFQAGIIGRVEPAPLSLGIESVKPAKRGTRAKLRVSCFDGMADSVCRGILRLRLGGKEVAKKRFRLGADLSRGLSLKLSRDARERLRSSGRLRLLAQAKLAGGHPVSKRVTLRLPAR